MGKVTFLFSCVQIF